ncbi:tripartite tricarboxylate transporter substrate binding protein [Siccirubricoccus sp. KC 17139]|uniref:Tripartite tricarboxylate transporter substrate binding protein n=1 Tax=Siccirubricoccus soli TaxID=2899147 RepID=A0ABT1D0N6_9PROT|nr:tripartite tricarboxylate transporter substrate binding protein [Siccirubricoccus soli]MCO6415478.1 tripartite tricarboxylate transporter substrate binding protein [Siccirubricoccus soli]MCP2681610.1 tripartite tricarboxylate transporter substrate binding protein [Siccirubricoccus soli]
MTRRALLASLLATPLASAFASPRAGAEAQPAAWPDRPIRMVVPFAAGTTTDILGRIAAAAISKGLGQPVVVDNRTGAGGTVGTAAVAQAAPDGYTLLCGTSGTMATNPLIMPGIPYDPVKGFVPIVSFSRTPVVLAVRPALGVASLAELLAMACKRSVSVGTAGTGTTGHLTTALIELRTGVPLTHAPYRDGARAVTDLLNGTLDSMVYHPLGFLPHIRSGALRPLATTGEKRHFLLPEVPTLVESGLAGAIVEGWWGVFAPAGTPAPVVHRVNALVNASLADPATKAELERQGMETMGGTPEQLAAYLQAEIARQKEVVEAAKITAD